MAGTPVTASGPLENGGHWESSDDGRNWSYQEFNAQGQLTKHESGRYGQTAAEGYYAATDAILDAQHPADLPPGEDLGAIAADEVLAPADPNDLDGDGTPNGQDADIDGDGIRNHNDANPWARKAREK